MNITITQCSILIIASNASYPVIIRAGPAGVADFQ